jgi:2-phosphoglycerate kinase
MKQLGHERHWDILLLGGAAAAGKSVAASQIALAFAISWFDVDALWLALKEATGKEEHPAFHHFEPGSDALALGAEHLLALHIETAQAVSRALGAVLDHYVATRHTAVIEGAWIAPEAAAGWLESDGVSDQLKAVFIYEEDLEAVGEAMMSRSERTAPSHRQAILARMSWLYGRWLRDEATRLGLPVVPARPRETLLERILEAAR